MGLLIILEEFGKHCTKAVADRYGMPIQPSSRTRMQFNEHFSKLLMDDGSARFNYVFSYPVPKRDGQEHATHIGMAVRIDGESLTIRETIVGQTSIGPRLSGKSLVPNPHDKDPSGIDWDGLFHEWTRSEVGRICMDRYWGSVTDYLSQTKQPKLAVAMA